jgi:O-antigen/teichoic acid export membrane protein
MNRLYKNFVLLAASNLLAPLFSMALVLTISRQHGAEMLGKYSLMMTVFVVGQSCATLGLPIVVTREVARARRDAGRYLIAASAVTYALLILVIGAALAALHWAVDDAALRWALGIMLVALLPSVITIHGESVLLAFERAGDFVAVNLTENVLRAALGTLLVLFGYGIVALAISALVLRLLASGALVVILHRRGVRIPARVDRSLCRELLRGIPVLGAIPIANALYARADVFLLTWLGTWTQLGLYSAALRLVDIARTLAPAYARALYPVLSRLRADSSEEFAALARDSMRTILLFVVPVALLLSGMASPIIVLLYGPPMAEAAYSLRVLAWSLVPVVVATMLAQILFASSRQAVDLKVNAIAIVASVAAGVAMIPRFGALGAAAGVLASSSLYAIIQYLWVRAAVMDPASVVLLGKFLATALAGLATIYCIDDASHLLAGAAGIATYAVGIWITGIIGPKDVERARLALWTQTHRLREAR